MTLTELSTRPLLRAANPTGAPTVAVPSNPQDGFVASKPSGTVKFTYNPQDALVMEAQTYTVEGLNSDISTDKIKLGSALAPSAAGDYVFATEDSASVVAASSFAAAARTVAIFSKAYGGFEWAFGSGKLKVNSDVGEQFNANYQRGAGSVNFYHATDPVTGQVVFSGKSGEVVAHEVGHAMLDALRPGYHETWSLEPKAFHESFGDVTAFLAALQDDRVIAQVVNQTGGDLSKPNIVAASGEELGKGINDKAGWNRTGGDWVRNLNNQLKWVDPDTLGSPQPGEHPDSNQLFHEAHNFSRIWSGAVYDIVRNIVDDNLKAGQAPADALKNASTEGIEMYARMMKAAPEGDFTFKDMANACIHSEQEGNGGKHVEMLQRVFQERNILPAAGARMVEAQLLPAGRQAFSVELDGPEFGKFAGATVKTHLCGTSSAHFRGGPDQSADELKGQMAKLIQMGDIKYTEPNQTCTPKDLWKEDGRPYTGVVRWTDGKMCIERVDIYD